MDELRQLQQRTRHIRELRGRGLMVGVVLDMPHKELRNKLIHEQHCFTGSAGTDMLRLLPPLTLSRDNTDDFIKRLETALSEL